MNIEQMLDQVSEFESKRDSIEAEKRALLDEVKIPEEVIEVSRKSGAEFDGYQKALFAEFALVREEVAAKLAEIQIPEEVRAVLEEIDHQRALVNKYREAKEQEMQERLATKRVELSQKSEAQTRQVYNDIAQRKQEIEAEFRGKSEAVDENIAALKKQIEAAVLAEGKTYQGTYLMAVWAKGRRGTWITGKLDGLAEIMPEINKCRNPDGEPTVTFRRK